MRKFLGIIFFFNFCFAQQPEYHPHRVLFQFKTKSALLTEVRTAVNTSFKRMIFTKSFQTASALSSFLTSNNIISLQPIAENASSEPLAGGMERIFVAVIDSETTVEKVIQQLKENPDIEYAEPDYIGHGGGAKAITLTPNDSLFGFQWSLKNSGQTIGGSVGKSGADVNMAAAWDVTTGNSSTLLAVLDSGIPNNASDFAGRMVPGYDYANNDSIPYDDHGHGSNTTSIAAATGNNSTVMAGVNWKCKIMHLKILDQNNSGLYSWWASALSSAANNGADVISLSVGGSSASSTLKNAIDYAAGKGCIVVACMMNTNNEETYYPAAYTNVIAVGALNNTDKRATPFCWGGGSNYGAHIDFIAPGDYILGLQNTDPTKATYWCGTSQATPIVSGLISLMLGVNNTLTFQQVYDVLKVTAKDSINADGEDRKGWDKYYGWGKIDAYAAVNYVKLNYPTHVPAADASRGTVPTFSLSQNYPNPFNPGTEIRYQISDDSRVTLTVYDVIGKEVTVLINEMKVAGSYSLTFNASKLSSGIYFYRLTTGKFSESKKFVLMK